MFLLQLMTILLQDKESLTLFTIKKLQPYKNIRINTICLIDNI